MTKIKIGPDEILTNFLRTKLTDINSSRSGQWIYPDFPRVKSLGDTSFPRIGITILSEGSDSLGIFDDNQRHEITLQIDCVTKKDLLFSRTITDEAVGTISSTVNTNRLVLDFRPTTVTNVKHNGTGFGTVNIKATDTLFTTPASLTADIVEVSFSTGNLNFSSADVTSYDGEAITSTYVLALEGKKQVQYLAREVWKAIRNNWRTHSDFEGLHYPILISNTSNPLDESLDIYRQTLEISFVMYNIGEGL